MSFTSRIRGSGRSQADAPGLGIALMIASGFVLSLNSGVIKAVSPALPVGQIIALRGVMSIALILALVAAVRGFADLRIERPGGHLSRGLLYVVSMISFIFALRYMPLADAQALVFVGPVLVTALAPFVLHERVGLHRWAAVLVGFAGVVIMLRPGSDSIQWVALLPVGSALAAAVRDVLTRRMSEGESSLAMLFYPSLIITAAGLSSLPFGGWATPERLDWLLLFGSAALIAVAHFMMIEAFRFAEASLLSPLRYFMLLWTGLLGYLVFAELPDRWALAGMALIVGAGFYTLRRETRRRTKQPPPAALP